MNIKVLNLDQTTSHGGTGKWTKNRWRTVKGELVPCSNGLHYCRDSQVLGWLGPALSGRNACPAGCGG